MKRYTHIEGESGRKTVSMSEACMLACSQPGRDAQPFVEMWLGPAKK